LLAIEQFVGIVARRYITYKGQAIIYPIFARVPAGLSIFYRLAPFGFLPVGSIFIILPG
jgi:hypothetical protein